MIPALLLTAGLATRLRPLSLIRAKGAFPVAGEPLVRRILRHLVSAGVTDVVINLHHLPHTIAEVVGDGSDLGVRVRYSWEAQVLGSAGGPARARPLLGTVMRAVETTGVDRERSAGSNAANARPPASGPPPRLRAALRDAASSFLIVNGDTLTNLDVLALAHHHVAAGSLVTMAVIPNTQPARYGGVVIDHQGVVSGFVGRGASQPSFHFIGVQVAEPEAFDSVPADMPYESVGMLYPALIAARPGSIRAFVTDAEFLDIGTAADYLETSLLVASREGRPRAPAAGGRIDPSARVERSILWENVTVGEGAMLRDCVVTDGVQVPADTSWHGVTIRSFDGRLAPGERRIDGLAVASL
jgi:mannose-1-phosphate guanylyltransferase